MMHLTDHVSFRTAILAIEASLVDWLYLFPPYFYLH